MNHRWNARTPHVRALTVTAVVATALPFSIARADDGVTRADLDELRYLTPGHVTRAIDRATEAGEIADPRARRLPAVAPRTPHLPRAGQPLSHDDIFPFEDSASVLLTNFSDGQLIDLMVEAANAAILAAGDNFDFIGYWVNFQPHHLIGAAFYAGVENDVEGIGDASGDGTPLFNERADLGLLGDHVEGFIMMWNINSTGWAPGTGSNADFTRLALAQEFEHRFAMFLPDLLDGRSLQGTSGCGRIFHWNWKVDGQGSGMEISEWTGASPPVLTSNFISFNTDIPGSVFSYTDLYLMGYVSPSEMDAGNSELRYMDTSNCVEGSSYFGNVSTFSSADIVASAGPRVPDHTAEDQHYRTAWIMIHQPGDPPSSAELEKAVQILEQHQLDWSLSTLGRGTMDNSLGELVAAPDAAGGSGGPDSMTRPAPNPLESGSTIAFSLVEAGPAELVIHDVAGRRVASLVSGSMEAGRHLVRWDGNTDGGTRAAPGVYFFTLSADGATTSRRVVLLD